MSDSPTVDQNPETEARAAELAATLSGATDRPDRSPLLARIGAALMTVGVIVTVVAVVLSQTTNNPLDQSTDLSLGLAGLAMVGAGAALYLRHSFGTLLRFWLLRLVDEAQQHRSGT